MRLLFVCLGNICRSPTAEGVMRAVLAEAGRDDVEVDSAGTGGWHVGHPPDARSHATALRRGITLEGAARQVVPEDFERFDLLLAADRANERHLLELALDEAARTKVRLLRSFDPEADDDEVPDPYHGGPDGFDHVLDVVEAACRGLLREL